MRTLVAPLILVVVAACAAPPPSPTPAPSESGPAPSAAAPGTGTPAPTARPSAAAGPWVAYQRWMGSEGTTIGLVRPDGSDDHALRIEGTPSQDVAHPDWSPDGRRLAFDVFFDDPEATLGSRVEPWVVGIDGGDATRLASCELPCLQLAYPTWSPDGSQLALIRYDIVEGGWGPSALEILDPASGVRREVAATADGLLAWYFPRWSPDGRSIVLVVETYTDAGQGTYTGMSLATVNVSGDGLLTTITPPDVFPRDVDWGAGDMLVASVLPALDAEMAQAELVVMRPDGSALRRLTSIAAGDPFAYQVSWDPAGSRLVVTTGTGGPRTTLGFVDPDDGDIELMPSAEAPRTHGRIQPTP